MAGGDEGDWGGMWLSAEKRLEALTVQLHASGLGARRCTEEGRNLDRQKYTTAAASVLLRPDSSTV